MKSLGVKSSKKKTGEVKVRVRKITKRTPVIAEGMSCFWVAHGPILADLRDLAHAFTTITDEQFFHHVSESHNDFSLWVMEVLGDEETARLLAQAKTKSSARKVVEKALKQYAW